MKNITYNVLQLFLLILLLTLTACSDDIPNNISNIASLNTSPKMPNEKDRLRLEVPSLMGWGELSEVKMTIGDTLELVATLENTNGESLPSQPLSIFSEKSNFFTESYLLTDHNGQATSVLLATVLGKDTITVTHQANLSATLSVIVSDSSSEEDELPTLKELSGVVSWKTLAKVTVNNEVPSFHQEIKALHGKNVKIQGFMLPLEQTEEQKHFLLSVNPPSCFFCLPAGPEGLVEVYSIQSLEFSYEPIIVSGTLKIIKNDEMGLYYRMQNAQTVRF